MHFTTRELTFDAAILFLAALIWFYTDREAVRETFHAALGLFFGL